MNHASLFSGIGGWDLCAEAMGWHNIFHCENNPFCKQVLKYYWPSAITYDNITLTDFTRHRGQIDILSLSWPCQPFSHAGKRGGTDDDRHLWPQGFRAIKEIRPTWVVGENVPGIVTIEQGLVFKSVCADLESAGYEITVFNIPACATGAPHQRRRIWFVAHAIGNFNSGAITGSDGIQGAIPQFDRQIDSATGEPGRTTGYDIEGRQSNGHAYASNTNTSRDRSPADGARPDGSQDSSDSWRDNTQREPDRYTQNASHPNRDGLRRGRPGENSDQKGEDKSSRDQRQRNRGESARSRTTDPDNQDIGLEGGTASRITHSRWQDTLKQFGGYAEKQESWYEAATRLCSVDAGLPGAMDGITLPKWRTESLKAAGNSVQTNVVYQIFQAIETYNLLY
jgi:DNA (cytosine-5)-methyltransferase 1